MIVNPLSLKRGYAHSVDRHCRPRFRNSESKLQLAMARITAPTTSLTDQIYAKLKPSLMGRTNLAQSLILLPEPVSESASKSLLFHTVCTIFFAACTDPMAVDTSSNFSNCSKKNIRSWSSRAYRAVTKILQRCADRSVDMLPSKFICSGMRARIIGVDGIAAKRAVWR